MFQNSLDPTDKNCLKGQYTILVYVFAISKVSHNHFSLFVRGKRLEFIVYQKGLTISLHCPIKIKDDKKA